MPSFRKRPVVVEAVQWWPPGDVRHDPSMLSHWKDSCAQARHYRKLGEIWQSSTATGIGDDVFMIRTLEGDLKVSPGDWIITGVKGEKYPCKPDVFEATYEPA